MHKIVLTLSLLAALTPGLAFAQADRTVLDRLGRLETELDTLAREVYRGGTGGPAAAEPAPSPLSGPEAAGLEVRLSQIEAQLRSLTGQVEQQGFALNRLQDQVNRLTADLEFRFQQLEGAASPSSMGDAAAGPANGAEASGSGSVTPQAPSEMPSATGSTVPEASASGGALGSLPTTGDNPAAPPGATPDAQYEAAFAQISLQNYAGARSMFDGFLAAHPDHRLAGNAHYWRAETFYAQGDMQNAAIAFAEAYQKYPDGAKAADNLLKLGMALGDLGRVEDACRTFGELQRRFPDAPSSITRRLNAERAELSCG